MPVDYHSITIIIPALNEEDAIEQVTRDLTSALPGAEIVVVNDGSTDRTEERASRKKCLPDPAGKNAKKHDVAGLP